MLTGCMLANKATGFFFFNSFLSVSETVILLAEGGGGGVDRGQRRMKMSHLAERFNQCVIGERHCEHWAQNTLASAHMEKNRGRSLFPQ